MEWGRREMEVGYITAHVDFFVYIFSQVATSK